MPAGHVKGNTTNPSPVEIPPTRMSGCGTITPPLNGAPRCEQPTISVVVARNGTLPSVSDTCVPGCSDPPPCSVGTPRLPASPCPRSVNAQLVLHTPCGLAITDCSAPSTLDVPWLEPLPVVLQPACV